LMDHRPLCTVPAALPWPFAAAVNCEALTPEPGHHGVKRDAAYDELLRQLQGLCEGLLPDVVKAWPEISNTLRAREAALTAAAWLQKRNKKSKGDNPLCELPLLKATDGRTLCIRELTEQREVLLAVRDGSLIEPGRFVWKSTEREQDLL